MLMLNRYKFEVELTDGRKKIICKVSKHIKGAVRCIYQTYNVERIVRIY